MSRPVNPDRGRLEIAATPEQIRAWLETAEADGLQLTVWLRRVADAEVRRAQRRAIRRDG